MFFRNENGEVTRLKTGIIAQAPAEYGNVIITDTNFPTIDHGYGIPIANTTIIEKK